MPRNINPVQYAMIATTPAATVQAICFPLRIMRWILPLFLVSFSARGTTYFVSTSGSDGNACTSSGAACLTITHAASLATSAGDIVQVATGTYLEHPALTHAGATNNPITFRGHSGACPTTVDSDPNSRGLRTAPTVSMYGFDINASWITVDCFLVTSVDQAHHPFINCNSATGVGHVTIINNYIDGTTVHPGAGMDLGDSILPYSDAPNNLYVAYNYVLKTGYGFLMHCTDCLFEYNEVEAPLSVSGSDGDYSRPMGDTITFRHNYFHGADVTLCAGCHIDCWQTFNVSGSDIANNITIDANVCFNSHEGVIMTNSAQTAGHDNLIVTNNLIAYGPNDTHPWCILTDAFAHVQLYNNTCIQGGTTLATSGNLVAKDNIFYNCGTIPYGVQDAAVLGASGNNVLYQASSTISSGAFPNDVLNQDPLFVAAGSNNYRIQFGSPAKAAGANLTSLGFSYLDVDLVAVARPSSGAWDSGAYQFSSPVFSGSSHSGPHAAAGPRARKLF